MAKSDLCVHYLQEEPVRVLEIMGLLATGQVGTVGTGDGTRDDRKIPNVVVRLGTVVKNSRWEILLDY